MTLAKTGGCVNHGTASGPDPRFRLRSDPAAVPGVRGCRAEPERGAGRDREMAVLAEVMAHADSAALILDLAVAR